MIELRFGKTEVRAAGSGSNLKLEGYAAVFNVPTQLPGFTEIIRPSAFDRALREKQNVVCLWNHNSDSILGRTTSGTLRLSQDSRGLKYSVDLPNTTVGRDAHESVRRKDVSGSSFGFIISPTGQTWSEQRDNDGTMYVQREITDLTLSDVSPVINPQYGGTEVAARAITAPVELRSAVASRNLLKHGSARITDDFVITVADIASIERNAAERRARDAEIIQRRRNLLSNILNS